MIKSLVFPLVVLLLASEAVWADERQFAVEASDKVGILLLNLGGPDGKENSVRGFLYNLFADPEIIKLPKCLTPLQKPLAYMISSLRTKNSKNNYAMISYDENASTDRAAGASGSDSTPEDDKDPNSPINHFTVDQCEALQAKLQAQPMFRVDISVGQVEVPVRCYFAMRYWHPFTDEVFAEMERDGINKLVILPLYPHYSISTTKSSLLAINEVFSTEPTSMFWGNVMRLWHSVVPYWYDRPGYVSLLSRMLQQDVLALVEETASAPATVAAAAAEEPVIVNVQFSAHGVPVSYIDKFRDPYQHHIEQSVLLIVRDLCNSLEQGGGQDTLCMFSADEYSSPEVLYSHHDIPRSAAVDYIKSGLKHTDSSGKLTARVVVHFHLSFQSKVGPVDWLQPYTDDVIRNFGKNNASHLVVVPISFVSDNIETLHEIDIEYQELAHESGVAHWRRAAVVNARDEFVDEMAAAVLDTLALNPDGSLQLPIVTVSDAIRHTSVGPPTRLAKEAARVAVAETTAPTPSGGEDEASTGVLSSLSKAVSSAAANLPAVNSGDAINGVAHVSVLSLVATAFSFLLEVKLEYMLTCAFGALLSVILS